MPERTATPATMAEEPAEEDRDTPPLTLKAMDKRREKDRRLESASWNGRPVEQRGEVRLHTDRAATESNVQKGDRGGADAASRDEADEPSSSGLLLVVGNCCWIGRIPP